MTELAESLTSKLKQVYAQIYQSNLSDFDLHKAMVAMVYAEALDKHCQLVNGSDIVATPQNIVLIGKNVAYSAEARTKFESEVYKIIKNMAAYKFSKAVINIQGLNQFYSALLYSMQLIWVGGFDTHHQTMGVGVKEMYCNAEFVYSLPMEELHFVILHELGHVSGLHGARQGKKQHDLWNIACDYYINRKIAAEYKLVPNLPMSGMDTKLTSKDFPVLTVQGSVNAIPIRVPFYSMEEVMVNPKRASCLFDPTVDVLTDTPESIYERLKQKKGDGGQQGNKGNKGKGKGSKSGSNGGGGGSGNQNPMQDELAKAIRKRLRDLNRGDKKHNGNQQGNITVGTREEQDMKGVLQRAVTKAQIAGCTAGSMYMDAVTLLKSKFNLRALCRVYLKETKSSKISYTHVNKRTMHTGYILPAKGLKDRNSLERIKICVDVSGSIGQKEINQFLTLLDSIMKEYKVDAELIFWDTKCQSIGSVINYKRDVINKSFSITNYTEKVCGGGGTDPSCLFQYFSSKECKVKPYAIFILTDGYIGNAYTKYAKPFKNVLWIISECGDPNFKSPIGLVKHWNEIEELKGD